MPAYTNGNARRESEGIPPKITLYTNHGCPFAHRAHIALKELDLPYEEVFIDLDTPREPWYLKINPRGLVPSIKYSDGVIPEEIIYESAIVAQFLADARPNSHLLPSPLSSPTAAVTRARIAFFQDNWNNKVAPIMYPALKANTEEEKEAKCKEWLAAIEKEIEPLLADAAPFFGGSQELTLAEVHTAPFLLRMYAMANGDLLPTSFREGLEALPNFGKWAKAALAKDSVTYIWDEKTVLERTKARIEKMKAQAK